MLTQVHRCINGRAPTYLTAKFTRNSTRGYTTLTRGTNKLYLRQPFTRHYHSSFEFQGAKYYNELSVVLKALPNEGTFKNALKRLHC